MARTLPCTASLERDSHAADALIHSSPDDLPLAQPYLRAGLAIDERDFAHLQPGCCRQPVCIHLALPAVVLQRVLLGSLFGYILVGLVVDDHELVAVAEDEVNSPIGERLALGDLPICSVAEHE